MLNIGVYSDLHIEHSFYSFDDLSKLDILILAGDIASYNTIELFFEELRKNAPTLTILYVMGNHEYYGMVYQHAIEFYKEICLKYNITLLENESIVIDDVLFLGATLWSNFQLTPLKEKAMSWTEYNVGDCFYIEWQDKDIIRPFTTNDMLNNFNASYAFLSKSLEKAYKQYRKIVVISHFLPSSHVLADEYKNDSESLIYSSYWCNELPTLYQYVDYWFYGHSHNNINKQIGKLKFLSNQRGYSKIKNLSYEQDYKRDFLIKI